MALDCLVVTCDAALLGQMKAAFSLCGGSLDLRQDSVSAIELASRRHLDGVVIDCDDVPGGRQAIAQIRNSRSNKQTMLFAITNGMTSAGEALDLGANFVLGKPLQENRLLGILEVAIPKMEREHRRYFRYAVDLPVRLRDPLGKAFPARLKNISEGGMAVMLADPVRVNGVVLVELEIPSIEPQPFQAKADIVWSDSFAMGLRFLYVEKNSGTALHSWLGSLESQHYFRESIP